MLTPSQSKRISAAPLDLACDAAWTADEERTRTHVAGAVRPVDEVQYVESFEENLKLPLLVQLDHLVQPHVQRFRRLQFQHIDRRRPQPDRGAVLVDEGQLRRHVGASRQGAGMVRTRTTPYVLRNAGRPIAARDRVAVEIDA